MFNLVTTRTPRPFSSELLPAGCPQHVLVPGAVPSPDFAFLLAELHEVPVRPFLAPSPLRWESDGIQTGFHRISG